MSAPAHARNEGPGGCVPWEEYEAYVEVARAKAVEFGRRVREALDRAEAAEAEVERLREALREIAEQPASVPFGTPWKHWATIAAEALEASSEPRP